MIGSGLRFTPVPGAFQAGLFGDKVIVEKEACTASNSSRCLSLDRASWYNERQKKHSMPCAEPKMIAFCRPTLLEVDLRNEYHRCLFDDWFLFWLESDLGCIRLAEFHPTA